MASITGCLLTPNSSWARLCEIHEAGALLVRPDGYVAWRQRAAIWDDDALTQLRSARAAVLSADY